MAGTSARQAVRCRNVGAGSRRKVRGDVRPDAVGTDQRDPAFIEDLRTALAEHADASAMGREILDAHAELERDVAFVTDGVNERQLQIAAMDRPVGRTETPLYFLAQWNAHDFARGSARHHPDRLRCYRNRCEPLAQPQRDQDAASVRRELNAGSGLFKFSGLFVDGHANAGARKRQRGRQSGDAGSGDDDMTRLRDGRKSRCRSGGGGQGQRALRRARRMRIKR